MDLNKIQKVAVLYLYPNGLMSKRSITGKEFHLLYLLSIRNWNKNFKDFIKSNNISIPHNIDKLDCYLTTPIDVKLTEKGCITFYSLTMGAYDFDKKEAMKNRPKFIIKLPSELTDIQKEILNDLVIQYDLSDCEYGIFKDGEIKDILYQDFLNILSSKTK
jgi:hypothetical protein